MQKPLQISVFDERQALKYKSKELVGIIELGRQNQGEEEPVYLKLKADRYRLIIARAEENSLSRQQLLIEPVDDAHIRLINQRGVVRAQLEDGTELKPREPCVTPLPCTFVLGTRTFRVALFPPDKSPDSVLQSLPEQTMRFRAVRTPMSAVASMSLRPGAPVDAESVAVWLQRTMAVLQAASSSSDFYLQAAQAAVDLIGLDSCRVLALEDGVWRTEMTHSASAPVPPSEAEPSRRVLDRVREERKTFWQMPTAPFDQEKSLVGVKAIVAAPILNPDGEVMGALYGDRWQTGRCLTLPPITRLDAMLVETLACGVTAGIARVDEEKKAVRERIQFEQFFTPELAAQLAKNPDMLRKGQDCEVSVLFSDIRNFTGASRKLGSSRTVEWIADVMGTLSDCVLANGGVVVDYIGDELISMWGAPEPQPDHAARACRAALDILATLPALNERWEPELGGPMTLGIGINSGQAYVGNTGTKRKFKYGPLGHTVNLASRVQGACKHFKTRLLVTEATHDQLRPEVDRRRIGAVRLVGMTEPVTLYEIVPPETPGWEALKRKYEMALAHFEKQNVRGAARALADLMGDEVDTRNDGPALALLARVITFLVEEPAEFEPVLNVAQK